MSGARETTAGLNGAAGWRILRLIERMGKADAHPGDLRIHVTLIVAMMTTGTLLHCGDLLPVLSDIADESPIGLTTRQSAERILFLLPVMYATIVFGARGGTAALAAMAAVLTFRVIIDPTATDHSIPEVSGVTVVAGLLVLAITQQRAEIESNLRLRDNLRYFVRQVLTAQEDERKRIALELHDETAQALLLTCQRLDSLVTEECHALSAEVTSRLGELRAGTVQTLSDLRRLTQNLRPRVLDDHGLPAAIEWLGGNLHEQYGIQTRVLAQADLPEHSPETRLLLFRIAQEALHNVGRHSGASEATVSLVAEGPRIRMTIEDNGRGFRLPSDLDDLTNRGKLGVMGMYERARLLGGTLDVRSSPGRGTSIIAEMPLSPSLASRQEARPLRSGLAADPASEAA